MLAFPTTFPQEFDDEETAQDLVDSLPVWMPDDRDTNNFKLMGITGRMVDRLESDIAALDKSTTVQDAATKDQIEALAELVDTHPREGEPIERYRARVIAQFQTNTTEGSIEDLITNSATILGIDRSEIEYSEQTTHGVVVINIPSGSLNEIDLTESQFLDIINEHVAAGFRVESTIRGSFTYISPSDYSDGNHDPDRGYDGLDSNNNPKGNGGTYAGVVQ